MPARYTVIQYVPDPIANERINIGIAGYGEGRVLTRFLTDWRRIEALFGEEAVDPDRVRALFRGVDEPRLLQMIGTWHNSIQFTEPGTSLRSVEDAVDDAARRFLIGPSAVDPIAPPA